MHNVDPPPMGGGGAAPLAHRFSGGPARDAMTYAQQAVRRGVELRAVGARTEAEVDMTRTLGVSDRPPVEHIGWHRQVDADAPRDQREDHQRQLPAQPDRAVHPADRRNAGSGTARGRGVSGARALSGASRNDRNRRASH